MESFFKCEDSEDICPKDTIEFLKDLENQEEIEIHINSGGGSVFGGLAIYNLLKTYRSKKTVYIDGLAGSIASVIALAGDEINIYESGFFMMHNPLAGMCGYYNAKDLQEQINILDNCKKSIINVYMAKVCENVTEEQIIEMMNTETWLIGKDVTKYFKMNVIPNKCELVACTSDYFKNYKNTPINILNVSKDENILKSKKQDFLEELEKISIF